MKKYILPALVLCAVAASAEEVLDLGRVVIFDSIFKMTASEFFNAVNQPGQTRSFDWVSQDTRDVARFPKWGNSPKVKFWGFDIWEGLAGFDEHNRLRELKISFYNKGDAAAQPGKKAVLLDKESYIAYFNKVNSTLSRWAEDKGQEQKTESMLGNEIKIRKKTWVKEPHYVAELEWSYSGKNNDFIGEYITLTLTALTKENDPRIRRIITTAEKNSSRPTAKGATDNIKKNFRGDVYLDNFPMVDQGAKGYCVVATLERILKYYGGDADQHLLAQMANSRGDAGTGVAQMVEALKRGGVKLGVRIKTYYETDSEVKDFEKTIENYNRAAKKLKKEEIKDFIWIKQEGRSRYYNIANAYAVMDWEVFKAMKLDKEKLAYKRFLRDIHTCIDQGTPLTWSIIIGKVSEPGLAQTSGFHMRTIIGYNDQTEELIYTDSWGQGHEFKKMAYDDAWSITTHVHSVTPRH